MSERPDNDSTKRGFREWCARQWAKDWVVATVAGLYWAWVLWWFYLR